MFVCDQCGKSSQPKTLCHREVTEKRQKDYEYSVTRGTEEKPYVKVSRSKGWEIVRESKTCQTCIDRKIDSEMNKPGAENQFDYGKEVFIKPKRKSRDEIGEQFSIKLPYDVLASNFIHKLEGLEELRKK